MLLVRPQPGSRPAAAPGARAAREEPTFRPAPPYDVTSRMSPMQSSST